MAEGRSRGSSTNLALSRILDPRPASEALRRPLWGAVNIPVDEIANRTFELPAKNQPLSVAAEGELALRCLEVLRGMGREAELIQPRAVTGQPGCRYRLWSPNPFLESRTAHLVPGRALDLACGVGRDAVFLASLGWQVTAIDWLTDGLERGRNLERTYLDSGAPPVQWLATDLRSWEPAGAYELVTMFFWLNRPLLGWIGALLAPGGSLLLETFTPTHREEHGKPKSCDLVATATDAAMLLEGLDVIVAEEGWHEKGHTLRVHARLPESI